MNKILKSEKRIMKKILNWLEEKPNHQDENFYGDFHIDQWCRIPDKTDWLEVGIAMYDLVEKNIRKTQPATRNFHRTSKITPQVEKYP